jgi:hypothetical protein
MDGSTSGGVAYDDQPSRSPWIAQLVADGPPRPLERDGNTDVVIVGAGIAGVATAFFALRDTEKRVLLMERHRVGRGASGRNAGQLTTYFERPLCDIADEFGVALAAQAQGGFDDAHDLLDLMVAASEASVRVERFTGHMGMFNLHHVLVHLRSNLVRRQGGLRLETCLVSDDAEFVSQIPADLAGLYDVVPQARAGSCWRRGTTDIEPSSRTARGVATAASWSSRCSPTWSSSTPIASGTSTTPASTASSSARTGSSCTPVAIRSRHPRWCCARTGSWTTW